MERASLIPKLRVHTGDYHYRHLTDEEHAAIGAEARAGLLAELRAKVQELPGPPSPLNPTHWALLPDECVNRYAVLALLAEEPRVSSPQPVAQP